MMWLGHLFYLFGNQPLECGAKSSHTEHTAPRAKAPPQNRGWVGKGIIVFYM